MSIKTYLKNKLPRPENIATSRYFGFLAPWLAHPRLWHMHRRSVALGIAIGLVTGLIPGPVQILMAVMLAVFLRANIPAAAFATFYTNPLTFIPLYMLAYKIGSLVTGEQAVASAPPVLSWSWQSLGDLFPSLFNWLMGLGDTLLIGLAIQSTAFAVVGYVGTLLVWRLVVTWMWRRRHARK